MALGEKIIDGAISLAPRLIPANLKKKAGAWLQDRNPFASIADNGDLRRVLRLAFIDAANEVLSAAEKAVENPEWAGDADPARYISLARPLLRDLRAATFDRRPALTALSSLDSLLPVALRGTVEGELPPGAADAAAQLTGCFVTVMTEITGETPPPLLIRLANEGVTTYAGPRRAFGPLLCAALAEILKKPQEYPEARAAFDMAMTAQTQDKLDEHTAKLDEILATLRAGGVLQQAADKGIPEAAVRAIVERLGGQGVAGDDLLRWLEGWIDAAQRELSRQPDPDKAFAAAADEAARRFRAGRLAEASGAFMDLFEQEEMQYQQHRQRQTRLLQEAIRYDELALNPAAAVDKLRRLAALTGVSGPEALGQWLFEKAGEYAQRGEDRGDNAALLVAIEIYRSTLLEWPRSHAPLHWAEAQSNLGTVLMVMGERESGTARLEAAIAACQAALQERPRNSVPLDWATTKNNLGNAFLSLGRRESGTARLEAAVAAYRAALQERPRNLVPLQWAVTQNNLGSALQVLGERKNDTALIIEAANASNLALQEFYSIQDPIYLSKAYINLSNALQALGQRESDAKRLEQAITACNNALGMLCRNQSPLQWATTQSCLGSALQSLGAYETGTARLEDAVAAYTSALQERTRQRVPLDWAETMLNLGVATLLIAGKRKAVGSAEQAIQHITDALALFREANHSHHVINAEKTLSIAQAVLEDLRRQHP